MTTLVATALIKPLLVLQLILSSSADLPITEPAAPTSFEASVYVTKAQKIRLSIHKTVPERMIIHLRQAGQSAAFFTQYLGRKVAKAALVLDVDQMPDGRYELEMQTASGRLTKQIDLRRAVKITTMERQLTLY